MTSTSAPQPATPSTSRRILAISVAIIAAIIAGFFVFSSLYTEFLWFDQLDFAGVLTTQWIATATMFAVGFLGMALPIFLLFWGAVAVAFGMERRRRRRGDDPHDRYAGLSPDQASPLP